MPNAYPVERAQPWGERVGANISDSARLFMAARAQEQERRRRAEQEQYERKEKEMDRARQQRADAWQLERNKLDISAAKQKEAEFKLEARARQEKEALESGAAFAQDPANAARVKAERDYFAPGGTQGVPPGGQEPPPQVTLPEVPGIAPGEPPIAQARTINPLEVARQRLAAAKVQAEQEGEMSGRLVRDEKGNLTPSSVVNARETATQRAESSRQASADRAEQARLNRELRVDLAGIAAGNKPAKPPTGAERTALGFYVRANEALGDAAQFEDKVAKTGLMGQARLQWAPNMLQTEEQQLYRQAQRAFTEARLRKESGAAIPENEYKNDAKTYFAQPGDKPEVIDRKRARRSSVLESLRTGSGRAYAEYTGEEIPTAANAPKVTEGKPAPAVGAVVKGYRFKGGDPAARESWEKVQ